MSIVKKPLITEKLSAQNEAGKYAFVVSNKANKIEIKTEIEKMYGVNVTSVNTIRTATKPKSRFSKGGVITGRTASVKKAIVTVAKGEIIDFYSSI